MAIKVAKRGVESSIQSKSRARRVKFLLTDYPFNTMDSSGQYQRSVGPDRVRFITTPNGFNLSETTNVQPILDVRYLKRWFGRKLTPKKLRRRKKTL